MSRLIITVDLDWACEPAIEETLDFLSEHNVTPTVFITHHSPRVEAAMRQIEVGLHPFFDPTSSHGRTITDTVKHVMDLPHNLPAFRCHRFGICNHSLQAMVEAGMKISSNVCTDLESLPPFRNRFGLLEVPIFLEDGGYLWRGHPLKMTQVLETKVQEEGDKVLLLHPMHFAVNTPNFSYMARVKQSMSRKEWREITRTRLNSLRWKGPGIRDLFVELLRTVPQTASLGDLLGQEEVLQSRHILQP